MPEENTDKIVRLLEEIRDLTKERNANVDSFLEATRQRYDDALQRQKEAQERALTQRRRFLWTLTPLAVLAFGFMVYLAFWVVPESEERQMKRQMENTLMMQSNYLSQPR